MATFAIASNYGFLAKLPRSLWGMAVAACVIITPVSALAQSNDAPYAATEKPCYTTIKKTDEQLVLSFSPDCDLRRLARAFPIYEDGKSISTQRYLQSLYAMNGRDRTDGAKPTVGRGCVRPGKPSPDATPGELAACPDGLMNYYATPTDDSMARIIVPFARALTYEEKLAKRVKELEAENAALKKGEAPAAKQDKPADDKALAASKAEADKKLSVANAALAAATAENEHQSFWLTVFVLFAAISSALATLFAILWYRADKKRPVKYVDRIKEVEVVREVRVEGDWTEREKKLTDAFEQVVQDKLRAKDKELTNAMARANTFADERDQAVAAAKRGNEELAKLRTQTANDARRIGELESERDQALDTAQKSQKILAVRPASDPSVDILKQRIAQLEAQVSRPVEGSAHGLAEDKFAAEARASQFERELKQTTAERDAAQAALDSSQDEVRRLKDANEFLASEKEELLSQRNRAYLERDRAKAETDKQSDRVKVLEGQLAQVTQERDTARTGNQDLRDQLETFRADATKVRSSIAPPVRAPATDDSEVVAALKRELADKDKMIEDFKSTFNSMRPPPADSLSSVIPPGPPKAPEGVMAGTAISSVTSGKSDAEITVAQNDNDTDEVVVLETLRDHLSALGQAQHRHAALKAQLDSLESIVQVAKRALEDAAHDDAKRHGQERLSRAEVRAAEVQVQCAAAQDELEELKRLGANRGYDAFRLADAPQPSSVQSEAALSEGLAKAIEDCRDIIVPPTYRWPAPQIGSETQHERDVLFEAAKESIILMGADPAGLKDKSAGEIANQLKTRAVSVAATASHNSQSFTTAHERALQLESVLAEEREAAAKVQQSYKALEREHEQAVMQKVALRDALLNANKLKRELQRRFDHAVEERRNFLEAQTPRTSEERLALAELRVAEAERETANLQSQLSQLLGENSAYRDHFEELERVRGSAGQEIAAKEVWDRQKQGIYNCLAALELGRSGDTTPGARADAEQAALKPPAVPKGDFRIKVQQRLALAEWGEVQSLFKTLVTDMSSRLQRGDRLVYLVQTEEDLYGLHEFLCMPLEYASTVDRSLIVRVDEVQRVHHAADPQCRRRNNDESVSVVRATRTLRPQERASETPEELQDLLGNGGRSPS